MKSQKQIVDERGITRISKSLWPCSTLIYLMAYAILCLCFMNLVQLQPLLLVHAANRNGNYPSTVRPIPTTTSTTTTSITSSSSSRIRNRLSFLPSSRKNNSRKAAKEAYLHHLQNELNIAQRQLYISQNTCSTLRRRFEDQRMETLELIALSSTRSSVSDDVSVSDENDIDVGGEEEEEQQIQVQVQQQELEIDKLQILLQEENEKYQQQKDKLNLLMEELKEMQVWKEAQEEKSNNEGKLLLQYEHQLQESNQKQDEYAEQVELLTLKLEAAEFAAMQRQEEEGEGAKNESSWERRANELKSELENVQAKYSELLLVHSSQEEEQQQQQQRVEEEIDTAIIQSAVDLALEKVEREWETRYATLEEQLNTSTEWAASLEADRDAALTRVAEAAAAASSSAIQAEEEKEDFELLKQQQQQQHTQLREELTTELMNTLTNELTEKLTVELTDTLTQKMERKYKKKMKRLRHEHKEEQQHLQQQQQQQQTASSSEEKLLFEETMAQQRQQILEEEMKRVKEEYDGEYQSKLRELEIKGEEQARIQKERMRKLVRALLEREAKQKKNGVKGVTLDRKQSAKKTKSSSSQIKNKEKKVDGEIMDGKGDGEEEVVPISSLSSSRKKGRSRPGVVPVRGNR